MTVTREQVERMIETGASIGPASPREVVQNPSPGDVKTERFEPGPSGDDMLMLGTEVLGGGLGEFAGRSAFQRLVGRARRPLGVAARETVAAAGSGVGTAAPHAILGDDEAAGKFAEGAASMFVGEGILQGAKATGRGLRRTRMGHFVEDKIRNAASETGRAFREWFGIEEQFRPPADIEDVRAAQQELMEQGSSLTAGQVVRGGFGGAARLESLVSGGDVLGILGGRHQQAAERLTARMDTLANRVARETSSREMGHLMADAVANDQRFHRELTTMLYDLVDQNSGGVVVDLQQVARRAAQENRMVPGANPPLDAVAKYLTEFDGARSRVSFADAQTLRREIRTFKRRATGTAKGFLEQMDAAITEQMRVAGGNLEPRAFAILQDADEMASMTATRFNRQWFKSVLKHTEPDMLARSIMQGKGNPVRIRMVRDAVIDSVNRGEIPPDSWARIQGAFLRDMLEASRAPGSEGTRLSAEKLGHLLNDRYSREALDELFPGPRGKTAVDNLRKLRRALEIAERKPATGSAIALVALQAGAIGLVLTDPLGMLSGRSEKGLAIPAVILGPSAVAALLADPVFAGAMTRGLTREVSEKLGSRVAGKEAYRDGIELVQRAIQLRDRGVQDIAISPKVEERLQTPDEVSVTWDELQVIRPENTPR